MNAEAGAKANIAVTVRPGTNADYERIRDVWIDAFGDGILGGYANYDRHFTWAFLDNPDRTPDDVVTWVAEIDGDLIAAWSMMPTTLLVRRQAVRTGWLENTAVASRAQRKGVGKRVFRHVLKHMPLTLGIGTVDASDALYRAEGAPFVPADPYGSLDLSFLASCRRLAAAAIRRRSVEAKEVARSLAWRLARPPWRSFTGLSIAPVGRFDEAVEPFLDRIAVTIPVMTRRTARKLNWLLQNPRAKYDAWVVRRSRSVCGYAIVRDDGVVLDLLVEPGDGTAFACLLKHLKRWARQKEIRRICGIVPAIPGLRQMYVRSGFVEEIRSFGLFYAFSDLERRDPVLDVPANWFVSLADSDLFTFQLRDRPTD